MKPRLRLAAVSVALCATVCACGDNEYAVDECGLSFGDEQQSPPTTTETMSTRRHLDVPVGQRSLWPAVAAIRCPFLVVAAVGQLDQHEPVPLIEVA